MTSPDEIADAARSLAPDERLWLIEQIWHSLPPEQWPVPSAEELAEVQHRSTEYDAGRETASPWSDVRERLHRRKSTDD